jgi:tripartite motif-containing protein 71
MSIRSGAHGVLVPVACALVLLAASTHAARAQGGWVASYHWGHGGSALGAFASVDGISDSWGQFEGVADAGNSRIDVFSPPGGYWTTIGSGPGTGDGQFLDGPVALASGHLGAWPTYAVDRGNSRVHCWAGSLSDPTYHTYAFQFAFGTYGSGDGQFLQPNAIAVDGLGFVYVGDALTNRIQKFTASGAFVTAWGAPGGGDGQFLANRGIFVNPDGTIAVADSAQGRIQVFSNVGTFLGAWGAPGSGPGQLSGPVAGDWFAGMLFVVERGGHRVQAFDASLQFVSEVLPGYFVDPVGVTHTDMTYIADAGNRTVTAPWWQPVPVHPTTWGGLKAAFR